MDPSPVIVDNRLKDETAGRLRSCDPSPCTEETMSEEIVSDTSCVPFRIYHAFVVAPA